MKSSDGLNKKEKNKATKLWMKKVKYQKIIKSENIKNLEENYLVAM